MSMDADKTKVSAEAVDRSNEVVETFREESERQGAEAYRWLYEQHYDLFKEHFEGVLEENEKKFFGEKKRTSLWPDFLRKWSPETIIGQGNDRVLEIGCGMGMYSLSMARRNGHVTGIDIAPQAIEMAQGARDRLGIKNAHFEVKNAIALDFPDCSFDWILIKDVIEHFMPRDVPTHLANAHRVLKPGGKYLVVTPNLHGNHRHRESHMVYFTYADPIRQLREAGFASVQTLVLPHQPAHGCRLQGGARNRPEDPAVQDLVEQTGIAVGVFGGGEGEVGWRNRVGRFLGTGRRISNTVLFVDHSRICSQFASRRSGCNPSPLKEAFRNRKGGSFSRSARTRRKPFSIRSSRVMWSSEATCWARSKSRSERSRVIFMNEETPASKIWGRA